LLDNACKWCDRRVRVNARPAIPGRAPAGGMVLAVSDDGPGIPAAERANVTRRFYRLDKSRHTPGSGLGLALVKAIGDLHGAVLQLDDNHPGLIVRLLFQPYQLMHTV